MPRWKAISYTQYLSTGRLSEAGLKCGLIQFTQCTTNRQCQTVHCVNCNKPHVRPASDNLPADRCRRVLCI